MSWPSATSLLESKLHWMARRLRKINEPSSIIEWTEAMQRVFKVYNLYLDDTSLSSPSPKYTNLSVSKGFFIIVSPFDTPQMKDPKRTLAKSAISTHSIRRTKVKMCPMTAIPEDAWASKALMETDGEDQLDDVSLETETEVGTRELWKEALLQKISTDRYHGCAYQGLIGECHPQEKLLREIAKILNRDYETDMTLNLKQFLTNVTAMYYKEHPQWRMLN